MRQQQLLHQKSSNSESEGGEAWNTQSSGSGGMGGGVQQLVRGGLGGTRSLGHEPVWAT